MFYIRFLMQPYFSGVEILGGWYNLIIMERIKIRF